MLSRTAIHAIRDRYLDFLVETSIADLDGDRPAPIELR